MAEAATTINIAPHEMRAAIRGAVGNREVTRNLGVSREQEAVVGAAMSHVRAAQGRAALDALAGDAGFTSGGWEPVLQSKIYTGIAPDGSRIPSAGTNEAIRFNEVRDSVRTDEDYMRHGYDNLRGTPAEVTSKRRLLREKLNDVIVSNQPLREALAPAYATHTIPTAVLEEILRDDGIARELTTILNDKLKPESLVTSAADAVLDTKLQVEAKAQERRILVADRDRQNDRLAEATTDRNHFNTQATYHTASIPARPAETRASAMAAIQGELAVSTEPSVREFKANLDNQQRLQELVPPPANLEKSLDDISKLLEAARKDPANGAHCREFESLYRQQQGNTKRIEHAALEITRLAGEIAKKDIEITKEGAKSSQETAKLGAGSGDFALQVEQAFAQAVKKHLGVRAAAFIDTYHAEKGKAAKYAAEEQDKQVDRYMQSRWVNHRPKSFLHQWRGDKQSISKGQAQRDFATFIGRGADALVAEVLRGSGISAEQQALMTEDKDFMEKKRTEVIGKMLAAYVVSGGKLKKGQIHALGVSAYGQNAIETTMKTASDKEKSLIQAAVSAGYTKDVPKDLRERMIEGAPSWLATKTTLQILLSPMKLLRPGAIGMGKLAGTIDVS